MAHADSPPLSLVKEKNTDNFRSSSAAAPPRRRFRDGAADKAAGRRFWFLLQIKIVLPTGIGEDEDEGKRRGIYTSNCVNLQNKSLGDLTKRCGKSRQNTSIVDETIVHARNKTTKTNPQRKKTAYLAICLQHSAKKKTRQLKLTQIKSTLGGQRLRR